MAGKAKDELTAIDGGSRPQRRKADGRSWTRAKEDAFLRALTESCNVKYAAGVAGVAVSNVYVKRGKDAAFRSGWDRALATGYAELELMMLERALHGVEKIVVAKDGSREVMREYSDRTGLALLRMHRDSAMLAEEEAPDEEVAEAAERILARLKKIGERGGTATSGASHHLPGGGAAGDDPLSPLSCAESPSPLKGGGAKEVKAAPAERLAFDCVGASGVRADFPLRWVERLAALDEEQRREFVAKTQARDLLHWDAMFECWSAKGQIAPSSDGWRFWLMMAGRGYGKTRAGAEWIHTLAGSARREIALVGATIDEARRVMVEGPSGLLAVARRRRVKLKWSPSSGVLTWPQGSRATLYSGENPDGLRGPEHDFAWCDELAKWRRAEETWNNMDMGLRRGMRPRALVTTTPKPMSLLEKIRDDEETVVTGGSTADNASLPERFVASMLRTYGGTRLGAQELDGVLHSDVEGSLFPLDLLDAARGEAPPRGEFDRIVVAVDPPASSNGDGCGIVVAGRCGEASWVLQDASLPGCAPERWAARAVAMAEAWGASHIVAEANNGGEMVRSSLVAADAKVRVKLVHASRGKVARAEPIAILFENGRARLGGRFAEMEAELTRMTLGGVYEGSGSPDRADACVWALSELMETRSGVPRVMRL